MGLDGIDNEIVTNCGDKDVENLLKRVEENKGIVGLLVITQSTWKLLYRQLLVGIARGLGFAIGGTFVLAVIYHILSYLISINIPYLTDLLKQFLSMMKGT